MIVLSDKASVLGGGGGGGEREGYHNILQYMNMFVCFGGGGGVMAIYHSLVNINARKRVVLKYFLWYPFSLSFAQIIDKIGVQMF